VHASVQGEFFAQPVRRIDLASWASVFSNAPAAKRFLTCAGRGTGCRTVGPSRRMISRPLSRKGEVPPKVGRIGRRPRSSPQNNQPPSHLPDQSRPIYFWPQLRTERGMHPPRQVERAHDNRDPSPRPSHSHQLGEHPLRVGTGIRRHVGSQAEGIMTVNVISISEDNLCP
jgi:hypothetical protein